ncbi:MAG: integrin alpha, partial [Planctomycetota bacterium]
ARAWSGATGAVLHTFTGGSASAFLGFSVAGPGDLDGDGRAEIAVGAPLSGSTVTGPVGQVFVFSGLTGSPLYTFNGSAIADGLGFRVAAAGDLNGDGFEDLLAGAPGASPGGLPLAGQAFAYSGANGALLATFDGSSPVDFFGWAICGSGDLDRDGIPEVVVGAPFADVAGPSGLSIDPGEVVVYSGTSAILTLGGDAPFDEFGSGVAGPGDLDGDGFPDLIVGAPFVEIGAGANVGRVRAYSSVGIPAGSPAYGVGCPGAGAFLPSIATTGGLPTVGHPGFGFVISRALGGAQAFLFASDVQNVPGFPAAGCLIHIAPSLPYPVVEMSRVSSVLGATGVGGVGSALKKVPIPNDP